MRSSSSGAAAAAGALAVAVACTASFALGVAFERRRRRGDGAGAEEATRAEDPDASRARRRPRGEPSEEPPRAAPTLAPAPDTDPQLILVGAGPGDASLATFAAADAIARADVLVVDVLVSEELVARHARADAVILRANKRKGEAHVAQRELEAWTEEWLARGKRVTRVKGGDPFVFGRGGEEVARFTRLGYAVKVVPGVSSALAAPLAGGVPVTTRGFANQVLVATIHGQRDETPRVPTPYVENRTVVFLMSVSRAQHLADALVAGGYPVNLGVVVVERATCPDQRRVVTTLERLARDVAERGIDSPAVLVVGGTAHARVPGVAAEETDDVAWVRGGVVFRPGPRG